MTHLEDAAVPGIPAGPYVTYQVVSDERPPVPYVSDCRRCYPFSTSAYLDGLLGREPVLGTGLYLKLYQLGRLERLSSKGRP